jgi:RimJ/RimL family protein N-acetyltransferase
MLSLMLKLTTMLSFRKPTLNDMQLFFKWANDDEVRKQSYDSQKIQLSTHIQWFEYAIMSESYNMYVFQDGNKENIGQVRIQKQNEMEALIGISIDFQHRGKGYAKEMLKIASDDFLNLNRGLLINAYIKENNISSKHSFEKAGFEFKAYLEYKGYKSFYYIKT